MRDSVRVPIRDTGEPGEAAHGEQIQRDRTSRTIRVPSRSQGNASREDTKPTIAPIESSPATIRVIDRVVSVAAAILRSGGRIAPAHKKYIALLQSLQALPGSLPTKEYEQILSHLKTLEKQQHDTEATTLRPLLTFTLRHIPNDTLSGIDPDFWSAYLQQLMRQGSTDGTLAAVQLTERLSFLHDESIIAAQKQLQSTLSPARYAAYALPTWNTAHETHDTVADFITEALADSPVSRDFFDSIYTRLLRTDDIEQLQRSTIAAVHHLEALGPNIIEQLQRRLGLINLDRYPRTQLHLLSALLSSDKSTIERLHRRDVRVVLADATGDVTGDLINIYDHFEEKSGTTLLFEVTKPSDFYRHLLFLDDYDIHPSTLVFAAHGTPKILQFGQGAQAFDLAIRGNAEAPEHTVNLSQSSLERIAREFMITGRGRSTNGKRQKKIIIASSGSEADFTDNLPAIEETPEKPKGRSIDVSFADTTPIESVQENAKAHTRICITSDKTTETVLQFEHLPGTTKTRGDF